MVRDVRPTTVENGDTLVVEVDRTVVLDAKAPVEVAFAGELHAPGEDAVERAFTLPGRVSGNRVLVTIDDVASDIVGGRSKFTGAVAVVQNGAAIATSGDNRAIQLQLFPSTSRKLAHELFGGREGEALVEWLGVEVEPGSAGLQVTSVRDGFTGIAFLQRYDCGQWRDGRCKGGPDGKVSLEEARSQGFTDEDTFAWADLDGSGELDRHEVLEFLHDNGVDTHEDSVLPPSPAAAAGIETGDVIAAVDGRAVHTVDGLHRAWQGTGATAEVALARDGGQVTVSVARYGAPELLPTGFLLVLVVVATGLLVILPVPVLGGLIVVWERKISGRMQSRPGPNRVGPNGWLQWLADGVKLIVKEDIIPTEADPVLFRLSPLLVFTGVFATFVVLPFSPIAQVADLDIGILYILSVTSIVVVGVIMGGWASNSKWSLLGGMRSAAQIISYELPASIAILTVVITVGSLSMQDLVRSQGGMPYEWHMFANPFGFVCFFIFFISALAEGNRTPFDLPEAESELVSGYNTEYSGFRFSIFALAEWVNLIVLGGVVTTVFLGGWNVPFVDSVDAEGSFWLKAAAFVIFAVKVMAIIFVCIWIRWTLPRFRVDHMMNMCWKYFMPLSLASLIGAGVWTWLVPDIGQTIAGYVIFAVGGLGVFYVFVRRVMYARRTTTVWDLRGV
jgi:NADH:ubiquinone oxidoreductase subunit H